MPPEAVTSGEALADAPVLSIEHPVGAVPQGILDHFLDSEGDRSVARSSPPLETTAATSSNRASGANTRPGAFCESRRAPIGLPRASRPSRHQRQNLNRRAATE